MKKLLVVLLALALVFSIATTAMAKDTQIPDYSDTKTSTEYAVDIYRLTSLGVLCGDAGWGGVYRPTDNLTRAEFAKIACFMFGKQDYIDYYAAQQSAFSDVAEGAWYEGWVNCAYDNGLMIGVGGGQFAPTDKVSKQEVATVTLRGVGYTDELPGDWPADYIAKSQEVHTWFEDDYKDGLSLFEYVQKIDGTAATRAEMAAIVNYCLDLYRVEYVGDQTMIAGVSGLLGVDADGYAYVKRADTNENPEDSFVENIMYTVMGQNTDLLWDVFDAWVEPTFKYLQWCPVLELARAEAAGWGYEDFEEGELLFSGKIRYLGEEVRESNGYYSDEEEWAVATNYYIFDQYLDGELWQLSNRYAMLTLQYNKKAFNDCEALFAEMLTDVQYDEEANADVYTYEPYGQEGDASVDYNPPYLGIDVYDYDWFKHDAFGIVKEVNENEVYLAVGEGDPDDFDYFWGTYDDDGMFCIKKGGCETHDQAYVILKDGKLQDPSCLKVNDVVYEAGQLNTANPDYFVYLYIAYTPVKATFDELVNGKAKINISGEDYWYCSPASEEEEEEDGTETTDAEPANGDSEETEEDAEIFHYVSYDNGYADGTYVGMYYNELYDKLTEDGYDGACLFVPAYAKRYVATLIFGADADKTGYGVITNFDFDHVYPEPDDYFAKAVDFFGPDGKQTGLLALDRNVNVGSGDEAKGEVLYGTLANYFFAGDDTVIADKLGKVIGSDVGYILLDPAGEPISISIDDRGFFADTDELDAAVNADDYGADPKSFKDMKITEDTIIFEITADIETPEEEETQEEETTNTDEVQDAAAAAGLTKEGEEGDGSGDEGGNDTQEIDTDDEGEGEGEAAEVEFTYKSVKLGDPKDYIDADLQANQIGIFAWSGKTIKVLYVVNPVFEGDVLFGLFDVSRADNAGGFAKYLATGARIDFKDNAGRDKLVDEDLVYAGTLPKDGKAETIVIGEDEMAKAPDITAGEFVVLIDAYGFAIDAETAKDVILNYVDGSKKVSDKLAFDEVAKNQLTGDTEYYDLTGDGGFGEGYFTGAVHADEDEYAFITVTDKYGKIIEIFRVFAADEASTTTPGENDTYDEEASDNEGDDEEDEDNLIGQMENSGDEGEGEGEGGEGGGEGGGGNDTPEIEQ